MSHLFSLTPSVKVQRSGFNRSNTYKTTFHAGKLIPFYCDEVLPGDTVNLRANLFCRMATPIVPIMDNLYLETFFFFVPNRLVWNNWQKFMGEQINPGDSIDFVIPHVTGAQNDNYQAEAESLYDYFGIPIGVDMHHATYHPKGIKFSALPLRAYCKIWNDFFRDENLQNSLPIELGDYNRVLTGSSGNDFLNFCAAGSCLPRGKRHDYFTSCLLTPQKFEALRIPLTGNAPVKANGSLSITNPVIMFDGSGSAGKRLQADDTGDGGDVGFVSTGSTFVSKDITSLGGTLATSGSGSLYADLSSVTAATINDLRTAFQIQRLLESQNRSGTRYIEILAGQFGVMSPDARLQRPEYLGGSSCRININPVMQTSATTSSDYTPQGNLAAYGVAADRVNGFVKSFVEHGYIIGLVNVRADLNYQQGLNRMWSRKTRYDFYWPTLAHLGEQAVLNKEIYAQADDDDEGVFGYQERWAEYRYKPNMITGKFRSTYAQPLDIWHLAQKFDSLPVLGNEFIQDNPPIDRVIAVPSEPEFLLDVYFKEKWVRPMPVYSVPGLIDHF